MKITVYAVLKDYFDNEFEMAGNLHSVNELKHALVQQNPSAKAVMELCRFAVGDNFIDQTYQLQPHDSVTIIPPSSGG